MRVSFFLASLLLVTVEFCWAQEIKKDSLATKKNPTDTSFISGDNQIVEIESYAKRFDPRKAMMFSAVFPGAGQFYNKKYWKMPLVYGGFTGLLYVVNFYDKANLRFRKELFDVINNTYTGVKTKEQIRIQVDKTRRERDFYIIMNGLFYLLQMVDAHVDAHLKEFDLNPKMQVSLEPMVENSMMTGRNTGIALKIKF